MYLYFSPQLVKSTILSPCLVMSLKIYRFTEEMTLFCISLLCSSELVKAFFLESDKSFFLFSFVGYVLFIIGQRASFNLLWLNSLPWKVLNFSVIFELFKSLVLLLFSIYSFKVEMFWLSFSFRSTKNVVLSVKLVSFKVLHFDRVLFYRDLKHSLILLS